MDSQLAPEPADTTEPISASSRRRVSSKSYVQRWQNGSHTPNATGGVFVPVFHPIYFDIGNYLRYPENVARLAAFIPRYIGNIGRMRRGAHYLNRP